LRHDSLSLSFLEGEDNEDNGGVGSEVAGVGAGKLLVVLKGGRVGKDERVDTVVAAVEEDDDDGEASTSCTGGPDTSEVKVVVLVGGVGNCRRCG